MMDKGFFELDVDVVKSIIVYKVSLIMSVWKSHSVISWLEGRMNVATFGENKDMIWINLRTLYENLASVTLRIIQIRTVV